MDQFPIDLLVFHGDLAGNHNADDGLAAASACASGLAQHDVGAARSLDVLAEFVHEHRPRRRQCSHVAEPTWMRILSASPRSARVLLAFSDNSL